MPWILVAFSNVTDKNFLKKNMSHWHKDYNMALAFLCKIHFGKNWPKTSLTEVTSRYIGSHHLHMSVCMQHNCIKNLPNPPCYWSV